MNIVIVEDEEFAARRLERMIYEIDPQINVVAKLESASDSVEWFKNHDQPDLIFMDIHLEDNLSFAIFDSITMKCPVVFTTATDEKSTKIFKQKQIDYLLKPIVHEELEAMIDKIRRVDRKEYKILDAAFFAGIINSAGK